MMLREARKFWSEAEDVVHVEYSSMRGLWFGREGLTTQSDTNLDLSGRVDLSQIHFLAPTMDLSIIPVQSCGEKSLDVMQ